MLSTVSLKVVVLATAGTLALGGTAAAAMNPTVRAGLSAKVEACKDALRSQAKDGHRGIGACVSAAAHARNELREAGRDANLAGQHGDRR